MAFGTILTVNLVNGSSVEHDLRGARGCYWWRETTWPSGYRELVVEDGRRTVYLAERVLSLEEVTPPALTGAEASAPI